MLVSLPKQLVNQEFTFLDSIYKPVSGHKSIQRIEFSLIDTRSRLQTNDIRTVGKLINLYGGAIHPIFLARILRDSGGYPPIPIHKRAEQTVNRFTTYQRTNQARLLVELFEIYSKDSLIGLKAAIKEDLPSVIFSGIIPKGSSKRIGSITGHSGCIVIDLDHIAEDKRLHALEILKRDPASILVFTSPSGDGIKAVFQTDFARDTYKGEALRDAHRKAAKLVIAHVEKLLSSVGIQADCSGVDPNRHCFLPYDENVYASYDAVPFELGANVIEQAVIEGQKKREKAAIALDLARENVTLYDAAEAIERARSLADEKYLPYEDITTDSGYSRHDYLFKHFGNYCSRFGIPEQIALEYGEGEFPELYSRDGLRGIKLAYAAGLDAFGTWGEQSQKIQRCQQYTAPVGPYPRYITPYAETIKAAMQDGCKLGIFNHTKAGKTFTFLAKKGNDIAPDFRGIAHDVAEQQNCFVRFVLPFNLTADQVEKGAHLDCVKLAGKMSKQEIDFAKDARVTATNLFRLADSVETVGIENTYLIIDEAHLLAQAEFMNNAESPVISRTFDLIKRAKGVVYLTATPTYGMAEYLGINVLDLPTEAEGQTLLNRIRYKSRDFDAVQVICDTIKKEVQANTINLDSDSIIVRFNSKESFKLIKKRLRKILPDGKRIISISKESKQTSCKDYEYITEHESLKPDVAICLVTSVSDTGININNELATWSIFVEHKGNIDPTEVVQFGGRTRKAIDKRLTLVYPTQATKAGKVEAAIRNDYIKRLRIRISALNVLDSTQDIDDTFSATEDASKLKSKRPIRRDCFGEKDYCENEQFILNQYHNDVLNRLSVAQIVQEVSKYDPRVREIGGGEFTAFKAEQIDKSIKQERQEIRESEQASNAKVRELLVNQYSDALLEARYHLSLDEKEKRKIRQRIGGKVRNELSTEAKHFTDTYYQALSTCSSVPFLQFLKLDSLGFDLGEIGSVFTQLSGDSKAYNQKQIGYAQARIKNAKAKATKAEEAARNSLEKAAKARKPETATKYNIEALKGRQKADRLLRDSQAVSKSNLEIISQLQLQNTLEYHFTDTRFINLLNKLGTLRLAHLSKTKAGREVLKDSLSIATGLQLRVFARTFKDFKKQKFSRAQIESNWRKVNPVYLIESPGQPSEAITIFNDLFEAEYDPKARKYVVKSKNFFDRILSKMNLEKSEYAAKNRALQPVSGENSHNAKKGGTTLYNTIHNTPQKSITLFDEQTNTVHPITKAPF